MHDTRIKMKDGREIVAPIYMYRPKEGWLSVFGLGEKLFFRDMESAVTEKVMDRINVVADRDELERASKDGWDGK